MRKLIIAMLLLGALSMPGCLSAAIKDKLSSNAAQLDGYVKKMDSGDTTPEEDKALIRVMRIWTWSMNRSANDETPPEDVLLILEYKSVIEDE